ncbi:MAG: hypothetical protein JNK28_12490 [Burkholderiaceae bacterium]|nr:hypothetical protein [Burkholderiaceae bacterium]
MKYLVLLLVVLVAIMLWKKRQRPAQGQPKATPSATSHPPLAMTRCERCGIHLPEAEAVEGRKGWYCGTAHRDQSES